METERLFFRKWEESDAEELFRYAKDPKVGPVAGWPPHTSIDNSRMVIRTVLSEEGTFAIVLKQTGLPIGSIGLKTGKGTDLTDASDECELGYWLGVPYWGKGLMTEAGREMLRYAFMDMGMNKVWAGYYDGNLRSKRVQEKLGLRYHHTSQEVPVPLMNEIRIGHVSCIGREEWMLMKLNKSEHDETI